MSPIESTARTLAVATDTNEVRQHARNANTVPASSLTPRPVDWFWPGRIPFGAVTVLAGHPGVGKSLLTLKLAADLTQGRTGTPAHALLLSAEDAREQVVLPRLMAARANLARVHFDDVQAHGLPRQLFLPDDVQLLHEMVRAHDAKLVVIDPLTAHLPGKVNSWQDQSIRLALAPVAQLAEATGAAIVVVSHLNKGAGSDPLQRLGGSIGLAAAARSVLLLARDPDDPQGESGSARILAHVKSNLGPASGSLRYLVETERLSRERAGQEIQAARIVEAGASHYSGSELLAPVDPEPAGATAEAIRFLHEELANGPRRVTEIEEAAHSAGLSFETVKKAKSRAGAQAAKLKGVRNGPWVWELADPDATSAAPDQLAA